MPPARRDRHLRLRRQRDQAPSGSGRFNMFAGRPMKDWVDDIAPKAGIVVAIGDCATYGGLPAVPPNRRIPADCGSTAAASAADTSDRTSSAGPGCRRQHPRLSRRTLTGSRRSSWRLPPDAPRTSRSTSSSGRRRSSRPSPRPGAPGCSSTPISRTRRVRRGACALAACSTSSAAAAR